MSYGILLLRAVLGATIAAHGAQKLFGWWGGPGLRGTAGWFGGMRLRAPLPVALAAALAELLGGLGLALGLLTPFAAFAVATVMLVAIATVHAKNGFWNTAGGFELNLLIAAAAVALAATGGARFSLDRLIGWDGDLSGLWWGVGVAGAAALAALAVLGPGRRPERPAAEEPEREQALRAA
ncbi:MAG TPA: DoxX family protein [Gaiellaceae bacterium]|nr:DoxX family protein [Gaiellaceae bacterium]